MQHFSQTPSVVSRWWGMTDRWSRHWRWLIRFTLMSLLGLAIALSPVAPTLGQLPLPSPTVSRPATMGNPPAGVQRLGAIETTTVTFDGATLFRIASPTVRDRMNPGNLVPVEVRAEQIEATLNRVIQDDVTLSPQGIDAVTNYDLETLEVYASTLNNENVIFVKDAKHPEPLPILTVTQSDATYYGLPVTEVTAIMRDRISRRLREALQARTAATLEKNLNRAAQIALGMVLVSLVLWFLQRLLKTREHELKARQEMEAAANPIKTDETSEAPAHLLFQTALRQQFSLQRRRKLVGFLCWLLTWLLVVVWILGISFILSMFPWTRQLSIQIQRVPIKLLAIWFLIGLLNRLGDTGLDYLAKAWEENQFFANIDIQRKSLRTSTAIGALKGLKTFLVYIIGITWVLGVLGLPIGSVLAIGGIIAFAISLGFQNLVKDVVNGFLILLEDQYAIGDVVSIGDDAGLVENMNLRITQLRDSQGQLITIPNSSIVQVRNLTRTWSRVDFAIEVDYNTDIDHALDVIRQVAQQMYGEPEWHDRLPEPPEILGVDQLSHMGMLIRVWLKTNPGQQWAVGREFRRRVRVALEQHGIAIGRPQQEFWQKNEPNPSDMVHGDGSNVLY